MADQLPLDIQTHDLRAHRDRVAVRARRVAAKLRESDGGAIVGDVPDGPESQ